MYPPISSIKAAVNELYKKKHKFKALKLSETFNPPAASTTS